jgi:hypothetical protein
MLATLMDLMDCEEKQPQDAEEANIAIERHPTARAKSP